MRGLWWKLTNVRKSINYGIYVFASILVWQSYLSLQLILHLILWNIGKTYFALILFVEVAITLNM